MKRMTVIVFHGCKEGGGGGGGGGKWAVVRPIPHHLQSVFMVCAFNPHSIVFVIAQKHFPVTYQEMQVSPAVVRAHLDS